MTKKLRIVLAQLNLMVGNINANLEKHIQAAVKARDELSADVIVFPELSLIGYPAEDLLLRHAFIADAQAALQKFIAEVKGIYCVVGHPHAKANALFNACSLVYNGKTLGRYAKQCLPNYGVFDERRYFTPGKKTCIVPIHDIPTALVICEDLWRLEPVKQAAAEHAQLILAPNASPFETDKHEQRVAVLRKRTEHHHVPIVYVNQIGGQDSLVFDGGSMVMNSEGNIAALADFFQETLLPVDLEITTTPRAEKSFPIPDKIKRTYDALTLAVKDYINKNNFSGVLVGLSGGIDSALTLTIAVDALGKERVKAIMMPSRYTDPLSIEDAMLIANKLGVASDIISIEPAYQAFLTSLKEPPQQEQVSVAEQNIQARVRAIILMALSNQSGHLVLTTGNRSEIAVGYCTLYGDMAGGFAPLKDVPKTLVYQLAQYRNQLSNVIPDFTLTRPPTAELAPNQKDEDLLPPYPVLDTILECYLNLGQSIEEIANQGFDPKLVTYVVGLIRKNEYKRSQAAIGPHINHKSFGKDWRYPLTNGFKG